MIYACTPESLHQLRERKRAGTPPTPAGVDVPDEWMSRISGPFTAIVPVLGFLTDNADELCWSAGTSYCDIAEGIKTAEAAGAETIILAIDSPGGSVAGLDRVISAISDVRQAGRASVLAWVDGSAFSAAYWVASQAWAIGVCAGSSVGSVGVTLQLEDVSGALAQDGIVIREFTRGKYKTIGAPWRPPTDEETAKLNADVDAVYSQFLADVSTHRPGINAAELGLADIYQDKQAQALGFVDVVADSLNAFLTARASVG
jgi:signal peptide peptidase SppA